MSHAAYDPETLLIGVMGRPHGLRGEMWLRPHNAHGSDLTRLTELIFEREGGVRESRPIESIRRIDAGWLVKMKGIESRTAADDLTNVRVRVKRSVLPPPTEGEFFVDDAIGCEVYAEDGRRLGVVDALFWSGAHDVMVIKGPGDGEVMIPAVPEFVRSVDARNRKIIVAWNDADD